MESSIAELNHPDPANVLCKSLFNTQNILQLSNSHLGKVIGMDRSTVSRLKIRGELKPESKQGELALLVIRIFRSVYALMGGDRSSIQHWFHTKNKHLQGVPAELIITVQGLTQVVEYLDAMRGKI